MVETGSLSFVSYSCQRRRGHRRGRSAAAFGVAKDTATTEDAYLQVIGAKTAALFAAARSRQRFRRAARRRRAALGGPRRNLGIAFQLVDDALDYGGSSEKLGKGVGDDFREGKITLPVVLSFRVERRKSANSGAAHWKRAR